MSGTKADNLSTEFTQLGEGIGVSVLSGHHDQPVSLASLLGAQELIDPATGEVVSLAARLITLQEKLDKLANDRASDVADALFRKIQVLKLDDQQRVIAALQQVPH